MKKIFSKQYDYATVYLYDNGIFHTHFTSYSATTIDQVKELTALRKQIFVKRKGLLLSSSVSQTIVPSEAALRFLHSDELAEVLLAHAYLIQSLPQHISISSSEKFSKFSLPTKGFKTIPTAIEWLLSFAEGLGPVDIPHNFESNIGE